MTNTIYQSKISREVYQDILEPAMTGNLKYTLMNDFLSKYSLQKDLYALQGLLSALLHVSPEDITSIEVLNPIEPGAVTNDKNCTLDVKLELNHESIINIEIQSRRQDFWPERSVTYLCRNFDHLSEGMSYRSVKPCIQIGILNEELFARNDPRYTDEFYLEYELMSETRHTRYTGKFQIKVLLLNHLDNADEQERNNPNGLYFWAKLFRAKSWEELVMIAKDNPRMKSFVGTVRQLSAEEKVTLACEARRRYSNEISTYEEEIKDIQKNLDKTSAELDEKTSELSRASAELTRTSAELDKASAELDKASAQLDKTSAELDKTSAELDKTSAELDKTSAELDKASAENAELRSIIANLQKQLQEAVK